MGNRFLELFGERPQAEGSAPGRVNLLGEHTDYNDGFVLPVATPQRTYVEAALSGNGICRFHSPGMGGTVECSLDGPIPAGFASYLLGCLMVLKERDFPVLPVSALVRSQVPMGAGLSSSAALETAFLRALRSLFSLELDDVTLALLAQRAETRYAGVNCGIMDQMASSLADAEHMLFLDTRTLDRKVLPLPEGGEMLVIDSGVPRALAGSSYNERRAECEESCRLLGVAALRDVTDMGALSTLPPILQKRARHVVSENGRVLEAAGGVSAARFGELMNESHESLRYDYEVSIPALDILAGLMRADSRSFGARLTGAGFGGACVAYVREGNSSAVADAVLAQYRTKGGDGRLLIG